MNRCPITYQICKGRYSDEGLKILSPKLKELHDFPFTAQEQRELAVQQATKLSIQGIQPKLSVVLNITKGLFEPVQEKGIFILKPPHQVFDELPQNEDLTMRLALAIELEVPLHGMIYNRDGSLSYFIRRFDRRPKGKKLGVEDFSQLLGYNRDTKYEASMEKLIPMIDKHCTFPMVEKLKLFRLTVFNFLAGNEDAHLKNFSLITRDNKVEFTPAYDLVNSTIVLKTQEEVALPIRGKKSRLNRTDLFNYFGKERLGLSQGALEEEFQRFRNVDSAWRGLINDSFLSPLMKDRYLLLITERRSRLEF